MHRNCASGIKMLLREINFLSASRRLHLFNEFITNKLLAARQTGSDIRQLSHLRWCLRFRWHFSIHVMTFYCNSKLEKHFRNAISHPKRVIIKDTLALVNMIITKSKEPNRGWNTLICVVLYNPYLPLSLPPSQKVGNLIVFLQVTRKPEMY